MKKQESIVKPQLKAPIIPGGKLIFIPFLPFPEIVAEIKKSTVDARKLHFAQLFYLKNKAVLYGPIGAPASINSLEKIRLLGLEEIILISYCGSLSPVVDIGQAFIPEKAYSDEGTSGHYLKRKNKFYYPDQQFLLKLKKFLQELNLTYQGGSIVSTDAPYRETLAWWKKMQTKGILAVDMEASAVLAFSEFYGIKSASLFIVSDQLSPKGWVNGLQNERIKELKRATQKYFYPLIFSDLI
ncbi:MAG: nucleoside phosphorylase [Candidatus Saccharicenans sp.]